MPRSSRRREPKRNATRKPDLRLRLAIASAPAADPGESIKKDVRLIRAAVMYADEVELLSPVAEIVTSLFKVGGGTPLDMLSFVLSLDDATLRTLDPSFTPPANPDWRQQVIQFAALSPEDWALLGSVSGETLPEGIRNWQESFSGPSQAYRDAMENMVDTTAMKELELAISRGILRVSSVIAPGDGTSTATTDAFVRELGNRVSNPRVHLLADESSANILRHLIDEGKVEAAGLSVTNASKALLGAGFLDRLPTFSAAPLDELLTMRSDLEVPLQRYRRAIAKFSAQLKVDPLSSESQAAVDAMYREEVAPAIADLREEFGEHGLVREIVGHLAGDVKTYLTGAIGASVGLAVGSMTGIGVLGVAAAAAPVAVQAVTNGALKSRVLSRELQRRDLYYLHAVDSGSTRT